MKNVGKVQIHGHTPLKKNTPSFNEKSNSWNIDTGTYYGFGLTGIKLSQKGELLANLNVKTNKKDIR